MNLNEMAAWYTAFLVCAALIGSASFAARLEHMAAGMEAGEAEHEQFKLDFGADAGEGAAKAKRPTCRTARRTKRTEQGGTR